MARVIGPDQQYRNFYITVGEKAGQALAPPGTPVPLYADNQASIPADVLGLDGSTIAGTPPTVLIGDTYETPQFRYPDGVKVVYTRVLGGPVVALYALADDRLDVLEAAVADLQPGGPAAGVPTARTITAGSGLTGGGDLTANRSLAVSFGTTSDTVARGDAPVTAMGAAILAAATDATNKVNAEAAARAAVDAMLVPLVRTISTTPPLMGGGDLSVNRTLSILNATSIAAGVLQLAGDLGGTAASPTVPGLASKSVKLTTTVTKTSAYAAAANELVPADATSGGFAITIPSAAAAGSGAVITVRKIDATANPVTLQRSGSDTINAAAASVTLRLADEAMMLISDGTSKWAVTGSQKSLASLDERYKLRGEAYIDVTDAPYGADKNGVVDASAAFQAAFDAAIGGAPAGAVSTTRFVLKPVCAPKGTYKLTTPPKVYGTFGFNFFGQGASTVLALSGALTYGIEVNGARHSRIGNFHVTGATSADTVTNAIGVNWTPSVSAGSCYGNTFYNIRVRDLKFVNAYGFGNDSTTFDVSQISVYDCYATGQWTDGETTWWQNGFLSGSGASANPLDHFYFGYRSAAVRYGLHANACSVTAVGGSATGNEVDFRQVGTRFFHISGFRGETSQRLFEQQGGATYSSSASLSDILWECNGINADLRFIKLGYGGTVRLNNVSTGTNSLQPIVYMNANRSVQVIADGLTTGSPIGSVFVNSGGGLASVTATGYTQTLNSQVIDKIPFWTKNFGAFAANQIPTFVDGVLLGAVGTGPAWAATGLAGATAGGRFVGATAAGPPNTGTFLANDYVASGDGNFYLCTVGGTPGTWATVGTPPSLNALAANSLTTGEIVPRRDQIGTSSVAPVSGVMYLTYFTADKTETINTLTMFTGTVAAAATPTLCRMGVYSVAGNGDLTLVASTPNDTALFAAANTAYPKALSSPWNKVVGQRYATALIIVSGGTMPNFHGTQFPGSSIINTMVRMSPAIAGRVTGQTDLTTPVTAGSLVGWQALIAAQMS